MPQPNLLADRRIASLPEATTPSAKSDRAGRTGAPGGGWQSRTELVALAQPAALAKSDRVGRTGATGGGCLQGVLHAILLNAGRFLNELDQEPCGALERSDMRAAHGAARGYATGKP
jgi:hypothetical protein